MSVVKVEIVHSVIVQVAEVTLKFIKLKNGVEIYMEGGNYSGDSIILNSENFASLLASLKPLLTEGIVAPQIPVTNAEPKATLPQLPVQSSIKDPSVSYQEITPRGPNKNPTRRPKGIKRVNTKPEPNSCVRWTHNDRLAIGKFLNNKGTWLEAAKMSGRSPKAVLLQVQRGFIPGCDYATVCKTAGPLHAKPSTTSASK